MDIAGAEFENISRNRKQLTMKNRSNIAGLPCVDYDEDRDEKPWQKVPSWGIILLFSSYLLLGYVTQLIEDDMPRVVQEIEAQNNSDIFSEESARKYLDIILGDKPRVAGTKYHYEKTKDLKVLIDSIARQAKLPVRTDWQFVSGDYWLAATVPYVNCYQNLSNIVAVLEGESGFNSNGTIGTSLLLNCHYDSVPFALGASDNGIFCAVMVEVLSKLSRRSRKLKHNIIFLFNGAEENPLQASHGFLQHPWSKGIVNVVNLDAAGMNGKPNVFQVSDPRLIEVYKRVVSRPNAQGFGEVLFKSGIIPSDTDFRIWRDFGDIHGIDIAFVKWGNVYHTRNDRTELVRDGVIQNAGDMLLNLAVGLADTEELGTKLPATSAVYFDYLNVFAVSYPFAVAHALDASVAAFAAVTVLYYVWLVGFRMSTVQELLHAVVRRCVAAVEGVLVVALCVLLVSLITTQLRYLSRPWLVVPLYWTPYLLTTVFLSHKLDDHNSEGQYGLTRSTRTLESMAATRLLMAATLAMLTLIPNLASLRYVITVPLLIMSVASLISLTVVRYLRLTAWQHLILEFILSLPSCMFLMAMALRLDAIMVPTAGRMPGNNPDFVIGGINVILAVLVSTTVHTQITTYDINNTVTEDLSGVVVTRQDAHTLADVMAINRRGPSLTAKSDFTEACEKHLHCNLPLLRPRAALNLHEVVFLHTGPPAVFEPRPLVRGNRSCDHNTCTVHILMTGAPHNALTVCPRAGSNLTRWSLSAPLQPTSHHAGRPVYFILHSTATYTDSDEMAPSQFTLTFDVSQPLVWEPIVEVSHHAHEIAHPEHFTHEYQALIDAMPDHFNIASTLTIRSNYVF